jgi:hypothetical protein
MTQVMQKKKVQEKVRGADLEVQDIVQKEKIQEIILETTLEVQDIVHDEENFLDSLDHHGDNLQQHNREQVLEVEVFEEVEEAKLHAHDTLYQSKRQKLRLASDTSANKRMK